MPGCSPKFSKDFEKAHLNVLEVFDICLDLASDSEKYFDFVIDEVSDLVHTIKSLCSRHLKTFFTFTDQFLLLHRNGAQSTGMCSSFSANKL